MKDIKMIKKIALTLITAIFLYLFSFFVVVSISMRHYKLDTSHSIYDYYDLLDKIDIIYSPVFETMHSNRTITHTSAKIYSSIGDLDDIYLLAFLYKNPDIHFNISGQ